MSGVLFSVNSGEIALVAATTKTVVQVVAAANHRDKITGWGVSFDGVSPTAEPVLVEVLRQTTAGTMSAGNVRKLNSADDETLQTTAQINATVEPTASDILDSMEVHPQSGYEKLLPMGQEFIVPGGGRLAIRCTAPANVNVVAKFFGEE